MANSTTTSETDQRNVPLRTPMFNGDMSAVGKLNRVWYKFFQFLAQSVLSSQTTVVTQDLSTPGLNEITTDVSNGAGNLIIILRLRASGILIHWDPDVFDNAPDGINSTNNTQSVFNFVLNNGKYLMLSYTTGKPISA